MTAPMVPSQFVSVVVRGVDVVLPVFRLPFVSGSDGNHELGGLFFDEKTDTVGFVVDARLTQDELERFAFIEAQRHTQLLSNHIQEQRKQRESSSKQEARRSMH